MPTMFNQEPKPRKPLRQRVAERQAGIADEGDVKKRVWNRRLTFFANVLQGIALLLLLLYFFDFMRRDFVGLNYTVIIFYAVVFVIGRGIKLVLDIQRASRR
jgi:hypothetical protein